jgi:hypothetical protein
VDHGFFLLHSVKETRKCHLVLLWVLVFPLYLYWQTCRVIDCLMVTLRCVRICVFLGVWVTYVLIFLFCGKLLFCPCSLIIHTSVLEESLAFIACPEGGTSRLFQSVGTCICIKPYSIMPQRIVVVILQWKPCISRTYMWQLQNVPGITLFLRNAKQYSHLSYIFIKIVVLCNYTLLPMFLEVLQHSWKPFYESLTALLMHP